MTLKTITASGDAYSVGHMIGAAVAQSVHHMTVHNEEFLAVEQRWSGTLYIDQLIAAARQAFPQYVRELEGMADGMGIAFERAFLWNCRGDLRWPDDISPAVAAGLGEGCTTLIMPATGEQPAMIAHNEDGSADFHGHCVWISANPDYGPGFESYLYPGMMPGHTMGANRAGIVQTINNIRVHDLKPGVPRHFICRAILDCTTMDEACDLLKSDNRASGFHHNLGSAQEGLPASVEAPASGCIIKTVEASPSAHANHLITPEFKNTNQEISRSSMVRQERADNLLKEGALGDGEPCRILFETLPGHEILRSPGDTGDDYGKTLGTGVFELDKNRLSIVIHDGPDNPDVYKKQITF
ncbi:MAG: peptidase C45 [Rhodospirillales bacterium]|nr:peptidase C45 [Rhodospirillales bacterium]